jgi:hypothetical protein
MTLQPRIPLYIVIGRITAVLGLSLFIALAIFILLAGNLPWALASALAALPFGALIFLIERAPGGSEENTKSSRHAG